MTINIVLAGPRGQMGQEAIKMILDEPKFNLIAFVDRIDNLQAIKKNIPEVKDDTRLFTDIDDCFKTIKADVFIDLTVPEVGYRHTKTALTYGVKSVIGTSGFSNEQVDEL